MYCPACGKQIPEESVFCIDCGARISDPGAGAHASAHTPAHASFGEAWLSGKLEIRTTLSLPRDRTAMDMSFSPDGQLLAAASNNQDVLLWDLGTGQAPDPVTLTAHREALIAVTFAPGGQTLASGGFDNKVILWDVSTGQPRSTLTVSGLLGNIAFSPDGALLAVGSWDKVSVWDVNVEQERDRLRGHRNNVLAVAFSPDGELLASGGADNKIRFWDTEALEPVGEIEGFTGGWRDLAFAPSGQGLFAIHNKEVILWDLGSGMPHLSFSGHWGEVGKMILSPTRDVLISVGTYDDTAIFWDARTTLRGTEWKVKDVGSPMAFSPDGRLLAVLGKDEVTIWEAEEA